MTCFRYLLAYAKSFRLAQKRIFKQSKMLHRLCADIAF